MDLNTVDFSSFKKRIAELEQKIQVMITENKVREIAKEFAMQENDLIAIVGLNEEIQIKFDMVIQLFPCIEDIDVLIARNEEQVRMYEHAAQGCTFECAKAKQYLEKLKKFRQVAIALGVR